MKGKAILWGFLCLFLSAGLFSQTVDELITQGDQYYSEMQDMETAKKAFDSYMKALLKMEDKYEAYWRISRIQYYIGVHSQEKKEQKVIFSQGIYYGEKAVQANSEKPDGYYWLGVNQGKYGEVKGILKSLSLVKPIKQAMNKVIDIDRAYEDGGADRVLGRVYFKLPGFVGGDKEKSLEHLLMSKKYGPKDPVTLLYLADTYLELKEKEKARAELEAILELESDSLWVSGVDEIKEEAEKMLQGKEFK